MSKPRLTIAQWLLPSLGNILFIAVFLIAIALGPRLLNQDGDLGRHLRVGDTILRMHSIPTTDLFSHSMLGEAFTPHEWLSEVIFTLFCRWMGLDGVVLLCAVLIAGTFTLVYRYSLRISRFPLVSFGLALLGAAASSLHWLARPHLFTLLAVILWILGLERLRTGQTRFWWMMPVGMALWANLHGAFIAGFVIWAIYGFGMTWDWLTRRDDHMEVRQFFRAWGLVGGVSFVASLLNPSGIGLWNTSLGYLQNNYLVGHTAEYLSPDFQQIFTWPFLIMIVLSILILSVQRGRLPGAHGILVAAWTGMGLVSARNIPIYAVVAAPVLAEGFGMIFDDGKAFGFYAHLEEKYLSMETRLRGFLWPLAAVIAVTVLLTSGAVLDVRGQGNRFDEQAFPVEAVNWLELNPQDGNVFNYFPWGGYLLYRSWPDITVFIDGQTDFYGEALTREYERIIGLQDGWKSALDENQIAWVILPRTEKLAQTLKTTPGWDVVYEDDVTLIIRR